MFSPDQLVVYPAQGVGKIERLERQEVGGHTVEFYIIKTIASNVTVMVPVSNARSVGLRTLCSREEAEAVLLALQDRTGFTGYTGQNWNRRYREYSERLQSGSLLDVSHVLKELLLISGEKDLSFGERRLQEQAMSLITSELGCVLDKETEEIKLLIETYYEDLLTKSEKKA